jgi:hypothetical protein
MAEAFRLVCDVCHAFRRFRAPAGCTPADLREHPELGPFVLEHEHCRPPLRVTDIADPAIEAYREHYEEAYASSRPSSVIAGGDGAARGVHGHRVPARFAVGKDGGRRSPFRAHDPARGLGCHYRRTSQHPRDGPP